MVIESPECQQRCQRTSRPGLIANCSDGWASTVPEIVAAGFPLAINRWAAAPFAPGPIRSQLESTRGGLIAGGLP
ncbi:hypothetical protein KRMM14A1004_15410 [Krasilnikovia sp. MM14-A1004]